MKRIPKGGVSILFAQFDFGIDNPSVFFASLIVGLNFTYSFTEALKSSIVLRACSLLTPFNFLTNSGKVFAVTLVTLGA